MTSVAAISILKFALTAVVSSAVVTEDLRHRRIPNLLCAFLLAIGILFGGLSSGWEGLSDGIGGAGVAFTVFLVPYLLGGMGGGDVKLMASFGAVTGFHAVLPALILVAVAGAVTSLLYLSYKRLRAQSCSPAIPYAPAIVVGSLLVAFSQIGVN